MNDLEFDALLARTLAPPARPADRAFVAQVGTAIAEAERFRAWRRRALRRVGSEALVLFALAGTAATLAAAPGAASLTVSPFVAAAAAGAAMVAWLALAAPRGSAVVG